MYKIDLRVDMKEAAAVERRRLMEQQRKARIFNARERTIGVDLRALEQQKDERNQREGEEKQRDDAFATEMNRCDKICVLLDQRQQRDTRENNKLLVDFRKEHQRMEDRREFDLNDPDEKKKSLPMRESDDDPRLTVSCLQKFDGEDLEYERRRKLQQKQMKSWTTQQMDEKSHLNMEEQHAERLYQLKACELDQRAMELQMAEEETRRALNKAMKDYNQALAKEKEAQKMQDKIQEVDDNFTEIANNIHGDLLSENPDVARSAFGPHRVVPDRWKGMSPQQVQEVLETREKQIEEKAEQLRQERATEEEWDRQRVAQARAAMVLEVQLKKKERQLRQNLAVENKELAGEHRAKIDRLNTEVYINPPEPSYFAQFNTSSR